MEAIRVAIKTASDKLQAGNYLYQNDPMSLLQDRLKSIRDQGIRSQGVDLNICSLRSEKEGLLSRALPDALAAATNWIHSSGMYGKPPSRFIRDITRIIFDPAELALNRVTTLDKEWVAVICQKAAEAYPGHTHATSGAVRNIISTMCSEARVSLGYNKNRLARKNISSPSMVDPKTIFSSPSLVDSRTTLPPQKILQGTSAHKQPTNSPEIVKLER